MGPRTERYVGRQLRLAAGGDLRGEIEYASGQRSTDWIWVTPRAVLLFECKSARMTLEARAGDAALPGIVERYIGKARRQLDRTARLIKDRDPAFTDIPADRPIIGVAVTSEPFYLANSRIDEYGTPSEIPSTVMSLRELEAWVTLRPSESVDALLEIMADEEKRTWTISTAMKRTSRARNPILERAWKNFDYIDAALETETSIGRR